MLIPTRLFTLIVCTVIFWPAAAAGQPAELLISEYVEGTSNNKAIEIYNPTGVSIDLGADQYKILMYFNGAITAATTVNLTGVIAAGATFVLAHQLAVLPITPQQTSNASFYNGDDAIVLTYGPTNIVQDAVGQIGVDPGTEWGTGLVSTADNTIRRGPDVCTGDIVTDDVFDPAIQWTGFATDTFSGLGSHANNCGPTPVNAQTWGSIKTLYR
jgi:predicted extracellular nuclease